MERVLSPTPIYTNDCVGVTTIVPLEIEAFCSSVNAASDVAEIAPSGIGAVTAGENGTCPMTDIGTLYLYVPAFTTLFILHKPIVCP